MVATICLGGFAQQISAQNRYQVRAGDTLEIVQEERYYLTQTLNDLLAAHAIALWRDIEAPDYEAQVNESYEAYLAGGGDDAHYFAHWRAMSDAAKEGATG